MPKLNDSLQELPPINQELVTALDWAWLIDFGQGDFKQAKADTEIALLGDWNPNNLLAKALVHQLQGEYNQALSLLEKAFKLDPEPEQQLIIATIAYLTERKAQENLADGFSIGKNKVSIDTLWTQKIQAIKQQVKSLGCRLQINLIQQIATILPCWRTTIAQQQDEKLRAKYQKLILEQLTEQLALYQGKDYFAIAEFFYCCFAELLALSGHFVAGWQLLENLAPAYLNSARYLETAWYLMCQGDLIVATYPFGKPIVFGYRLEEDQLNFATIQALERTAIDTGAAQQQYLQARQYFAKATAPRGEAMAVMRLAYINGVQKQWYLAACGYEEAEQAFETLGDRLNGVAALMGYLWSFLQYEPLDAKLLARLEQSALWMGNNGTVSFALSWLLAFVAAAQEILTQETGIVVSQRFIQVAETIAQQGIERQITTTSHNCQQLWQKYGRTLADFYRHLALQYALSNDWENAFIVAEKISIYGSRFNAPDCQPKLTLEDICSPGTIASFLPQNTILLSFLVVEDCILTWAINQEGLVKTNLSSELEATDFHPKSQAKVVNLWLNNLLESSPNPKLNKIVAHLFLQPFTSEIAASKHLVIVFCDRLQGLPFSALKYSYAADSPILKKEVILGEVKTISYLIAASQIINCELVKSTINKILLLTEEHQFANQTQLEENSSLSDSFSLGRGLALATAELYNASLFDNVRELSPKITATINLRPIIHLFLTHINGLFEQIQQQPLANDLVILSLRDLKLRQIPNQKLINFAYKIINLGTKTVVIFIDGEDSLATTILTSFFYQGLYFGQSIAEAMQQATKQLKLVTAQEALDFCHYLQTHISWQIDRERALRALITKYTGDVMVLGRDYNRATEAYGVAIKILQDVGYHAQAQSLENKYQLFRSLKKISQPFQTDRLIFDAPAYWNNAYIYGDWQLSFLNL